MDFSSMSKTWRESVAISRLLIIANLLLSVALLAAVSKLASQHERVVVIPPSLEKKIILDWGSATPDYHKSMAYYLTGVIASAAPRNVDFVAGVVERFAAPEIANALVRKVRESAVAIDKRTQHQVAWFEGKDIKWEDETGRVFITGAVMLVAGPTNSRVDAVFEYRFVIRDGQPKIVDFDSYPGTEPHTLSWKAAHPQDAVAKGVELSGSAPSTEVGK